MTYFLDKVWGFDAAAAAAWEAHLVGVRQSVAEGKLTPELGGRLCDALGMVVWFQGYRAGRLEPSGQP